ncbi:unnamed protein product [Protopolystoma xenopodis]|uniref:Uncharacterized protein n=1 Tax=Protopolystoma xenopodis TaxID=117903 RepID=A0A3S5B6B4_9PLAT|nr:unnamed protein product [Protopolystoma xenopodis]
MAYMPPGGANRVCAGLQPPCKHVLVGRMGMWLRLEVDGLSVDDGEDEDDAGNAGGGELEDAGLKWPHELSPSPVGIVTRATGVERSRSRSRDRQRTRIGLQLRLGAPAPLGSSKTQRNPETAELRRTCRESSSCILGLRLGASCNRRTNRIDDVAAAIGSTPVPAAAIILGRLFHRASAGSSHRDELHLAVTPPRCTLDVATSLRIISVLLPCHYTDCTHTHTHAHWVEWRKRAGLTLLTDGLGSNVTSEIGVRVPSTGFQRRTSNETFGCLSVSIAVIHAKPV